MGQSKTKTIINKLKRNNRRKQNLVVSLLFWIGCSTRVLSRPGVLGDKFLTRVHENELQSVIIFSLKGLQLGNLMSFKP